MNSHDLVLLPIKPALQSALTAVHLSQQAWGPRELSQKRTSGPCLAALMPPHTPVSAEWGSLPAGSVSHTTRR